MANKNLDVNYFKIGTFVLVGIGLIITALLVFGSSHLFRRTAYLETYFDESVQGISIGSSVKYRGLQVGYVKEMAFTTEKYETARDTEDPKTGTHVRSIYIKIALTSELFNRMSDKEFRDLMQMEVASGLRVKLQPQGLTGTTYLELNYVDPKEHPIPQLSWQPDNFYIPAVPNMLAQLADGVQYLIHNMREINFREIFNNLGQMVASFNKTSDAVSTALNQFGELKGSLKTTVDNLAATSGNLKTMSEQIKLYPSQLIFGGKPPHIDPSKL
jgi:phospholipid/cholesterol/gamma-HCH transport system substrate-binding protein